MKKVIALILALIMAFSMGTVALAGDDDATSEPTVNTPVEGDQEETPDGEPSEDETTGDETAEDSLLGEYDWILDLPFGTVKPALKIAKIVLKLAKVYVKLGLIFGIIDKEAFMQQIGDFIGGLIGNEEAPEVNENVEPDGDVAVDDALAA